MQPQGGLLTGCALFAAGVMKNAWRCQVNPDDQFGVPRTTPSKPGAITCGVQSGSEYDGRSIPSGRTAKRPFRGHRPVAGHRWRPRLQRRDQSKRREPVSELALEDHIPPMAAP